MASCPASVVEADIVKHCHAFSRDALDSVVDRLVMEVGDSRFVLLGESTCLDRLYS